MDGQIKLESYSGKCLSILIRALVILCIVERLIAWHSFEQFNVSTYDSKLDYHTGEYRAENMNFKSLSFDFMVGFDTLLPPEIGRFDFSLLTYDA